MPLTYINEAVAVHTSTDWRAIWAGVFTFFAIWSVFGFWAWPYSPALPTRMQLSQSWA